MGGHFRLVVVPLGVEWSVVAPQGGHCPLLVVGAFVSASAYAAVVHYPYGASLSVARHP